MSFILLNENFEKVNSFFKQIDNSLSNVNKDLIWEGSARKKFDKNTETIKNDFQQLFYQLLKLKNYYNENPNYQYWLYL